MRQKLSIKRKDKSLWNDPSTWIPMKADLKFTLLIFSQLMASSLLILLIPYSKLFVVLGSYGILLIFHMMVLIGICINWKLGDALVLTSAGAATFCCFYFALLQLPSLTTSFARNFALIFGGVFYLVYPWLLVVFCETAKKKILFQSVLSTLPVAIIGSLIYWAI